MKTSHRAVVRGATALLFLAGVAQASPPPTFAPASTNHGYCGNNSGFCGTRGFYGGGFYGGFIGGGFFDPVISSGYTPAQPTTIINNYYIQAPGQPPVARQPLVPGYGGPPSGADPVQMPAPTLVKAPQPNVVRVDINLPSDAVLSIQGVKMPQIGTTRRFVSPPLERGQNYTYELRATWKENGREVKETRQLRVRAGDQQSITFSATPTQTARAGR